jgi:hypothetical protein
MENAAIEWISGWTRPRSLRTGCEAPRTWHTAHRSAARWGWDAMARSLALAWRRDEVAHLRPRTMLRIPITSYRRVIQLVRYTFALQRRERIRKLWYFRERCSSC